MFSNQPTAGTTQYFTEEEKRNQQRNMGIGSNIPSLKPNVNNKENSQDSVFKFNKDNIDLNKIVKTTTDYINNLKEQAIVAKKNVDSDSDNEQYLDVVLDMRDELDECIKQSTDGFFSNILLDDQTYDIDDRDLVDVANSMIRIGLINIRLLLEPRNNHNLKYKKYISIDGEDSKLTNIKTAFYMSEESIINAKETKSVAFLKRFQKSAENGINELKTDEDEITVLNQTFDLSDDLDKIYIELIEYYYNDRIEDINKILISLGEKVSQPTIEKPELEELKTEPQQGKMKSNTDSTEPRDFLVDTFMLNNHREEPEEVLWFVNKTKDEVLKISKDLLGLFGMVTDAFSLVYKVDFEGSFEHLTRYTNRAEDHSLKLFDYYKKDCHNEKIVDFLMGIEYLFDKKRNETMFRSNKHNSDILGYSIGEIESLKDELEKIIEIQDKEERLYFKERIESILTDLRNEYEKLEDSNDRYPEISKDFIEMVEECISFLAE